MHNRDVESQGVGTEWIAVAVHDLCQPLTALQCRLFLGTVGEQDVTTLKSAIRDSLIQCERMMAQVRSMQEKLNVEGAEDCQ